MTQTMTPTPPARPFGKSRRGFASMDPAKRAAICSKGGKAAHAIGRAHEFTKVQAAAAAKQGHALGRAHEFTSEEARIAGRKGGLANAIKRRHAKVIKGDASEK